MPVYSQYLVIKGKRKKKESEKRFDKIYAISELLNNNTFFFILY